MQLPSRIIRTLLLLIGAVGLAGCSLTPEQEAAEIERGIMSDPLNRPLWQDIKREYPEQFNQLISRLRALSSTEKRDETRVLAIAEEWMTQFQNGITPTALKAPRGPLLAMGDAHVAMVQAMQRHSVRNCAAVVMGQPVFIADKDSKLRSSLMRRNRALITAATAGEQDPRDYAEPSDADFVALGDKMRSLGIAERLLIAWSDEAQLQALSDTDKCDLGTKMYEATAALPDEQSARLMKYFLSPA